jgi:hypothetical protein
MEKINISPGQLDKMLNEGNGIDIPIGGNVFTGTPIDVSPPSKADLDKVVPEIPILDKPVPSKADIEKADKEIKEKQIQNKEELKEEPEEDGNKEPIIKTEENQEIETVIGQLQKTIGEDVLDNEGKPKSYEDTFDGIKDYVEDLAETKANKLAEDFLKQFPDAYELAVHIANGGTKESFYQRPTYTDLSKIQVAETDIAQHEAIIRARYEEQGLEIDAIDDLIESAKDKGKTLDLATKSLDVLKKNELLKQEHYKQRMEADRINKQQQQQQLWKEIDSTINKGELLSVKLSKEEQNQMRDYFNKPIDKSGNTLRNKSWDNLTMEQELFLNYLVMTNFKGVQTKTQQRPNSTLTSQLNKNKPVIGGNKGNGARETSNNVVLDKSILKQLENAQL